MKFSDFQAMPHTRAMAMVFGAREPIRHAAHTINDPIVYAHLDDPDAMPAPPEHIHAGFSEDAYEAVQ